MPFVATWMQLEILILNEVKSERERQILYDTTYMWNLKYDSNDSIYRNRNRSWTWRTDLWLPGIQEREGDGWGVWG